MIETGPPIGKELKLIFIRKIPNSKVISFAIDNLLGSDDRHLKQDDYICMDHVGCLELSLPSPGEV